MIHINKRQLSPERLQKKSDDAVKRWKNGVYRNSYSRCKAGYRPEISEKYYFRSSWEANYARYLEYLSNIGVVEWWGYETKTFWFDKIKRGVRSYRPDFEVKYLDSESAVFVEVKGWMDKKSKTKIKRMAKYHPNVELIVVGATEYKEIESQFKGMIDGWE